MVFQVVGKTWVQSVLILQVLFSFILLLQLFMVRILLFLYWTILWKMV